MKGENPKVTFRINPPTGMLVISTLHIGVSTLFGGMGHSGKGELSVDTQHSLI